MSSTMRIDFACNSDTGDFAGSVRMIDYAAGALRLEGDLYGLGYCFSVDDTAGTIRLHRETFRFLSRAESVGNRCWTAFWFEGREAKRLIRRVKTSGKWSVESGRSKLCDWFRCRDSDAR